jgi:gluconokinase
MLVLAIDLGTSSCRSALFDARGRRALKTTCQRAYPLHSDASGRAELDPGRLFTSVRWCIDHTLAGRGGAVASIGISCFWHSLLGLDGAGRTVTPIITWADSRADSDAARLRRAHPERAYHARTGCMLRATFWPAKLRFLARTQPRVFARVRRWVSPAEWLLERLSGVARCAHGMATGTGLYDPALLRWDPAALRMAGIDPARLNPISDEPCRLDLRHRQRWPRLAAAACHPAIGDGAANNLGAGAIDQGAAAINFGTSAAIRVVRESGRARAPFGLFCYRIDRRRFLIGGAISNAGSLFAWCQSQLRLPGAAELEAALAQPPEDDPALSVLPFWVGERSPSWRSDLRGAILGISQATTALDLTRAITTASYQRLALVWQLLPKSGRMRLLVGGGILHSRSSLQRLSDCLGHALIPTRDPELSLRGAAILALERGGAAIRPPALGRTTVPNPRAQRIYRRERVRLAALERLLLPPEAP